MANKSGAKWTHSGSKSRNQFGIDWSQFAEFAERLDELGADLKKTFNDVMEQVGETVQEDTVQATQKAHLPAKGKYSQEETIKAIDTAPTVEWQGFVGSIPLGFDKTVPSAGGFLITGTPKMKPDYALEDIYVSKKYTKLLTDDIMQAFEDEIASKIGG